MEAAVRSKPQTFTERLKAAESLEARLSIIAELPYDKQVKLLDVLMAKMPRSEREKVAAALAQMSQTWKPQTPEQLHKLIEDECGFSIPTVGVCPGHCAPFDFLSDAYFEQGNPDKLVVGNRGSGKTLVLAVLHAISCRTKPDWTGATVGAVLSQANRCYEYFRKIAGADSWLPLTMRGRVNMGGTEFKNHSKVEILTGTITGVNSPHPNVAHLDEIELLREGVYEEALNMAQSSNGYRAQNILTSSWKLVSGPVTKLMDQVEQSLREGVDAPYQVYRWCTFETTKQCQHDCSACPFANVVKGKWEDGSPRTFEGVCKQHSPEPGVGKLKFARGFADVEDAVSRFRKLSKRMWEAQQESKRPTAEGLVYDNFDEDAHTIDWWDPEPSYGPVSLSVDFGGTNPHAIGFWQGPLHVEVEFDGVRIPEGAHVLFDQVYIGNAGNVEAGKLVNAKLEEWESLHPGLIDRSSLEVYGDPAAKAARLDWKRLSSFGSEGDPLYFPLEVIALGSVDVEERIALVYEEVIGRGLLFVDRMRCPDFMDEIGSYERDSKSGKIVKANDHFMDSMGYRFWNLHVRKRRAHRGNTVTPIADYRPRAVRFENGHRTWDPEGVTVKQNGIVAVMPRARGLGMGDV